MRERKILNVCAELQELLLLDVNVSQKKTNSDLGGTGIR